VAALIKSASGIDSVLVEGARGEFTVWVGNEQVAGKDDSGFPTDEDVLSAVQQALARTV
jgi:hypothetical protein